MEGHPQGSLATPVVIGGGLILPRAKQSNGALCSRRQTLSFASKPSAVARHHSHEAQLAPSCLGHWRRLVVQPLVSAFRAQAHLLPRFAEASCWGRELRQGAGAWPASPFCVRRLLWQWQGNGPVSGVGWVVLSSHLTSKIQVLSLRLEVV